MKRPSRHIKALVLAVVYTLIALSPLELFVLPSTAIAHAITGECAGDCSVCDCSPERSASRTCCCWQKKLQDERKQEQEQVPDCCKKKERDTTPVLTCACPCGDRQSPLFSGTERFEQLPFHFSDGLPVVNEERITPLEQRRQTDRHGAPPDPPPKLVIPS